MPQAMLVGMFLAGLGYAVNAGVVPSTQQLPIISGLTLLFAVVKSAFAPQVLNGLGQVASVAGLGMLGMYGGTKGLVTAGLVVLASIAGPGIAFVGPIRRVDYFHYLMAAAVLVLGGILPVA